MVLKPRHAYRLQRHTGDVLPGGGEDFVEMVVPELRRRGLFPIPEYEFATLRENLGLRRVINRYDRNDAASGRH